MSLRKLLESYRDHMELPWRSGLSSEQRSIFCVYDKQDELRIRHMLLELRDITEENGHSWTEIDLAAVFPTWFEQQEYLEEYFKNPNLISDSLMLKFLDFLSDRINTEKLSENTVLCIYGTGTLLGIAKVRAMIEKIAPEIPGRLVVLFPGTYKDGVFRLLDAYDGWGYLATVLDGEQAR